MKRNDNYPHNLVENLIYSFAFVITIPRVEQLVNHDTLLIAMPTINRLTVDPFAH